MEQQKPTLKFKANIPSEVELTFDEPKTGEGQYGTWYLYGCKHEGSEKVFFPSELLHKMIQLSGFKSGSKFTILKNEGDEGRMFFTVDGKKISEIQGSGNEAAPESLDADIPF
jgi:hypothetical protein|tara:strand:- start:2115 stop:2453 length:339 start_codon:yes stop_codon:yes gene_type:complete